MAYVTLRRAGGSLVLTIPRVHAKSLGLEEGERMNVTVADGKLIVAPHVAERRKYRLEDLLAQCDRDAPLSPEDAAWIGGDPVGAELL